MIAYQVPFTKAYEIETTGYRYNSLNVITFGRAQSDVIKWLLLYLLNTNEILVQE